MTRRLAVLLLAALAPLPRAHAQHRLDVTACGAVRQPGIHALPADTRLSAAIQALKPEPDAYLLGTALLRQTHRAEQARWKAGVLFDLAMLSTSRATPPAAGNAARQLARQLQALPVTGRAMQRLEAHALAARPREDLPVNPGDQLCFPRRPSTVRIVGAVRAACTLPHQPGQRLNAYLRACPLLEAASRDEAFVIQPDGAVERRGIALWNRSDEGGIAPGATVFIPLPAHVTRSLAPGMDEAFARFLATQPLTVPEP